MLRELHGMPGFSDSLIKHLGAVARDHQVGVFDDETSVVEDLTGRPPEKLEAFLERNQEYLNGPSGGFPANAGNSPWAVQKETSK